MHLTGVHSRVLLATGLALLALALRSWYAGVSPGMTDEYNYVSQAKTMRAAIADGDYAAFTGPMTLYVGTTLFAP